MSVVTPWLVTDPLLVADPLSAADAASAPRADAPADPRTTIVLCSPVSTASPGLIGNRSTVGAIDDAGARGAFSRR
jgi:hypothetical protein